MTDQRKSTRDSSRQSSQDSFALGQKGKKVKLSDREDALPNVNWSPERPRPELTPIWGPEEISDLEKYIDFHRRHPHCASPRLNKDLPLENGETGARLVDPEIPGMSFTKLHFKPPPLPKIFEAPLVGLDADIDEVSTISMIHEHQSILSYMEDHDDPWYNMSVKDQLEQSHCDGSHTTVKWKRKKPPPMTEFDMQLAWQMEMYGGYAGGAPPLSAEHIENISKMALTDKSTLKENNKKKKVSPWARDYEWSRFTAAGEALDDFKHKTRQKNVDDALRAYKNETTLALKTQKMSQKKSMKKDKASEAAVLALTKSLLSNGMDKLVNFSSNSSVSSFSSASLLAAVSMPPLAQGAPESIGAMVDRNRPNKETGLDPTDADSVAASSLTGDGEEFRDVVQPFNIPTLHLDEQKEEEQLNEVIDEEKIKKKKKKKRKKRKKLWGNNKKTDDDDDDDDDDSDEDLENFELLDEYDIMKQKMGGNEVAEQITAELQKVSIQASKAARMKKQFVDTSLDFFEACDKLRVIKVISLLAAGKGDPNLLTSEDEPLFIHCLNRLLRMDQVTNSLHPDEKDHETSDRKKMQRILDSLVQYGADINTDRGREGQRPVHLAAASNNTKVILWMKKLPKMNLESLSPRDQWTPLIIATRYAHIEMMATLLRCGVNIDQTDGQLHTALHHAAKQGHTRAAMFLLRVGADKMLRTIDGKTAAGLAQDGNFLACSQGIASFATPILSAADQLQHLIDLEAAKKKKKTIQLRDIGGLLSKKLLSGYESMTVSQGYYWKELKKSFQRWWRGDAPIESVEDDEAFLQELQAAEEAVSRNYEADDQDDTPAAADNLASNAVVPFSNT